MNDGLSVIFSEWLSHDTALNDYGLEGGHFTCTILMFLYLKVKLFVLFGPIV